MTEYEGQIKYICLSLSQLNSLNTNLVQRVQLIYIKIRGEVLWQKEIIMKLLK